MTQAIDPMMVFAMGTCAAIGVLSAEGWSGTLVSYDGYPDALGPRLLDLVVERRGDLAAVWELISSAPDGWLFAFWQACESGEWAEAILPRVGPPLIVHDDPIITGTGPDGELRLDGPEYWYLFDFDRRTLSVYEPPSRLIHRARFDEQGYARFEETVDDELDWRNRRTSYGRGDPKRTAQRVIEIAQEQLPCGGAYFALYPLKEPAAALTEAGLLLPMQAWASSSAPLPGGVQAIAEHDSLIVLPRRLLHDFERCELAIATALDTIRRQAQLGKSTSCTDPVELFQQLFPFGLLDLELAPDALEQAIRAAVSAAFEDVIR